VIADTITVLQCADPNRTAQKTFLADGTDVPYRAGAMFNYEVRTCAGIEAFAALLTEIEQDPCKFIIRGRPKSSLIPGHRVQRRYLDPGACFDPQPRLLNGVDSDQLEAPEAVNPTSREALEYVVSHLPPEFHNISYVAQWSSNAGRRGQKIKAHFWFYMTTPCRDEDMRTWAKSLNASFSRGKEKKVKLVDPALYTPVQPHYTARPRFEGVEDPFANRPRVVFVKKALQQVNIKLPERAYSEPRQPRETDPELVCDDTGKAVDGREGLLLGIRWRVLHNNKPTTEDEFIDLVWEKFQAEAVLGETAYSSTVWTFDKVAKSCRADWKRWGAVIPEAPRATLTAPEASEQSRAAIRHALSGPGCTGIKGTPGMGKTVVAANELIRLPGVEKMNGEVYAPTRAMQREWHEHLVKAAGASNKPVRVLTMFGRDRDNCKKHTLAAELEKNSIPVGPALCQAKVNGQIVQCEHFKGCPYLAQFDYKGPGLRIYNHAHLATPRKKGLGEPQIVVIDENFTSTLAPPGKPGIVTALRGTLPRPMKAEGFTESLKARERASAPIKEITRAIESGRPILEELRGRGLDAEMLREVAEAIVEKPSLGVHPGKTAAEIRAHIQSSDRKYRRLALRTIRALETELRLTDRRESHAVKRVENDAKLCVRTELPRVAGVETIMILDADLEEENLRPAFPSIRVVSIDAIQRAEFSQCEDRSFSKRSLGLLPGQELNVAAIAKLAEQIRTTAGGRGLVVTYKNLIPHLKELLPGRFKLIHFGGFRGSNRYKDCDSVFVIGRNFPGLDAVEDLARALHYDDPEPLNFSKPIRRRHAVGPGVVECQDYMDSRLQAIMRSIREAETRQAVGRLRLVYADAPKQVFLYSSQPVGLPIDRLFAFKPDKAEILVEELGGFLPLKAEDLARLVPAHFSAVGCAQKWRDLTTLRRISNLYMRRRVVSHFVPYRHGNQPGPPSSMLIIPSMVLHPEKSLPAKLAAPGEDPAGIVVSPLPWVVVPNEDRPEELRDFPLVQVYKLAP